MKKFMLGFLVGAILFSSVPISAAIEEFICYRADYKVLINGEEYISEDFPVLNYKGNTYAPFRSILEKAGLNVAWNAELGQAEVTSNPTTAQNNILEGTTMSEPAIETITQTPDGITQIDTWEGKQYIGALYIRAKVREKGYDFSRQGKSTWQLTKNGNVILSNIPTYIVYGANEVEAEYYINVILPLIE